jgi:hypothetical protein
MAVSVKKIKSGSPKSEIMLSYSCISLVLLTINIGLMTSYFKQSYHWFYIDQF